MWQLLGTTKSVYDWACWVGNGRGPTPTQLTVETQPERTSRFSSSLLPAVAPPSLLPSSSSPSLPPSSSSNSTSLSPTAAPQTPEGAALVIVGVAAFHWVVKASALGKRGTSVAVESKSKKGDDAGINKSLPDTNFFNLKIYFSYVTSWGVVLTLRWTRWPSNNIHYAKSRENNKFQ